ncbi:MAG: SDR family oxidoreductase [Candidatus Omnitrophica bacterium]|nr:SDR family oxidoreductase [Candidatus Omnitrophota bacterium]
MKSESLNSKSYSTDFAKTQKTVLITGGTGGIGEKIVFELAKSGISHVFFTFFKNEEKAKLLSKNISSKFKVHCQGLRCDVSNFADVKLVVDEIFSQTGRIDFLINNAGVIRNQFIIYMTDDDWDAVIDVNLKGCFNCIKAVGRKMMKSRQGKIVNISSTAALLGAFKEINYAASKAGILGLTKTAALEFDQYGVKIFTLIPGMVETDMITRLSETERKKILQKIPMRRFCKPQEIASTVLFLISDNIRLKNGFQLSIDGGLSLDDESFL